MFKQLKKYGYMIVLGAKYIQIFKKIYEHPFISLRQKYKTLSKERQNYSNAVLQLLGVDVVVHGTIPKENRILYAINHRSLLDIIVMEHIFSKTDKMGIWIAKQELFDAFYGDFFRYSGCVSVDLETKRGLVTFFKTIRHLLSSIEDLNIYIFPEGERNKEKKILSFQGGAVKIAKTNNMKIVPVFIDDHLEKVFKDAPFTTPHTVHVHFGESIDAAEKLEKNYHTLVQSVKGEK